MEDLKQKCLELMAQKLDFLNRIVDLTRAETFTGNEATAEAEVDAFISLYEKRTAILSRIEKIDDALGQLDPLDDADMQDTDFQNQVVRYREAARDIAVEMLAMDRENAKSYEKLNTHMKNSMKNVRQTKELSNKYLDDVGTTGGGYLDKRN